MRQPCGGIVLDADLVLLQVHLHPVRALVEGVLQRLADELTERPGAVGAPPALRTVDTGTEQGQRSETVVYTVDTADRVLYVQRKVDGQPARQRFEYTERGQVWRYTSPTHAVTTRTYDPMGNLVEVKDAENHITRYTLDNAGRVEIETGPHPGYKSTYAYDELGRLKSKTVDAHGSTPEAKWTYTYLLDTHEVVETATVGMANPVNGGVAGPIVTKRLFNARDRLVREEVSGQDGSRMTVLTLEGPWQKSVTVSEGTWQSTRTYASRDDRGLVLDEVEEWRGEGQSYRYQTVTNWTLRAGDITFTDEAGGQRKERTAKVEVDSLGNMVKMQQGVHISEWLYDADGMLVNSELAAVERLHSGFEYEYDERGNRTKEKYRDAAMPVPETQTTEYGYDEADRLTGVRYSDGTALLYRLASDGTRLQEKEVANYTGVLTPEGFAAASARRYWSYGFDARGGVEGIYDELNRDTLDKATRTVQYVTDTVGRLVREETASGIKEYGWDAAGRLVRAVVRPGVAGGGASFTAMYTYGWDGLRVSRTVGEQATGYLWAGRQLLEERLRDGTQLYAQAAGLTVAVGEARIAHDGLGSAVGRVQVGATDATFRYDAWGGYQKGPANWTVPGNVEASLGYTGHSFDADLGLVYAQQRWYHPRLGRFMSEDPLFGNMSDPTSLHRWGYANGNPLRYTDPDGRCATLCTAAVGGFLGGVGGCLVGLYNQTGCAKTGAMGAGAGFVAGLTPGGAAAVLGVDVRATLSVSAIFTVEGGKLAIASALGGFSGGFVSGFAGSNSHTGLGRLSDGFNAGIHGAVVGAIGGPLLAAAGGAGLAGAARLGIASMAFDSADQLISMKLGLQTGYDPSRTVVAAPLPVIGYGGAKYATSSSKYNLFNYRFKQYALEGWGNSWGIEFDPGNGTAWMMGKGGNGRNRGDDHGGGRGGRGNKGAPPPDYNDIEDHADVLGHSKPVVEQGAEPVVEQITESLIEQSIEQRRESASYRMFGNVEDAATDFMGQRIRAYKRLEKNIGDITNDGVKYVLKLLHHEPDEFKAVQYGVTGWDGKRAIMTVFEHYSKGAILDLIIPRPMNCDDRLGGVLSVGQDQMDASKRDAIVAGALAFIRNHFESLNEGKLAEARKQVFYPPEVEDKTLAIYVETMSGMTPFRILSVSLRRFEDLRDKGDGVVATVWVGVVVSCLLGVRSTDIPVEWSPECDEYRISAAPVHWVLERLRGNREKH